MTQSYEPTIHIDPKIYPFLEKWGKANGYEVKTNDTHTILYRITIRDPIVGLEMQAKGDYTGLTRAGAMSLVDSLERDPVCQKGICGYKPQYNPPVRIDEDMFTNYFVPYTDDQSMEATATHAGIFWDVLEVKEQGKGGQFLMCRSEVTAMIRDLEFDRRHVPFFVRYQAGSTTKEWRNNLDSFEACAELLEREKRRHISTGDWRIYRELTAALRQTDDIPEDVKTPEGWLILRQWHRVEYGGEYWTIGDYDSLHDLRADMLQEEAYDIHTVTAIYACVRHDPPPEQAAVPLQKWFGLNHAGHPAQIAGIAILYHERQAGIEAILYTCDPEEVDRVNLSTLNAAIRSTHIGSADRALLLPVYKALKIEDGAQWEKFVDNAGDVQKSAEYRKITEASAV